MYFIKRKILLKILMQVFYNCIPKSFSYIRILCLFWIWLGLLPMSLVEATNPLKIKVTQISASGVNLSWEPQSEVLGYFVYYKSNIYEKKEHVLPVYSGNSIRLKHLIPDAVYDVSIASVDLYGEEGLRTEKQSFKTLRSSRSFTLNSAEMISQKQIQLTFSEPVKQKGENDFIFKIHKRGDQNEKLRVSSIDFPELSPHIMILWSWVEVELWAEYELVAIDVESMRGEQIMLWIDGLLSITVPDSLPLYKNIDLLWKKTPSFTDKALPQSVQDTSSASGASVLSSAMEEEPLSEENNPSSQWEVQWEKGKKWSELATEEKVIWSASVIEIDREEKPQGDTEDFQNTVSKASELKKLPQAGPLWVWVLGISFCLSGLIILPIFRRASQGG